MARECTSVILRVVMWSSFLTYTRDAEFFFPGDQGNELDLSFIRRDEKGVRKFHSASIVEGFDATDTLKTS